MVELLLLAAALSADNFAVSIGYGSSNTRISPGMTALLNRLERRLHRGAKRARAA